MSKTGENLGKAGEPSVAIRESNTVVQRIRGWINIPINLGPGTNGILVAAIVALVAVVAIGAIVVIVMRLAGSGTPPAITAAQPAPPPTQLASMLSGSGPGPTTPPPQPTRTPASTPIHVPRPTPTPTPAGRSTPAQYTPASKLVPTALLIATGLPPTATLAATPVPTRLPMPTRKPTATPALTQAPTPTPMPAPAPTPTLRVVASYPVPGGSPRGLAWDGTSLWLVTETGAVYRLDTTGSFKLAFTMVAAPEGLAWDGTSLWFLLGQALLQTTPLGQILSTLTISDESISPRYGPAWDGSHFWLIEGYELHEHHRDGHRMFSFGRNQRVWPAHGVAFDGAALWVDGGRSGRLQRVCGTGALLQSFDVRRGLGIALNSVMA